MFRKMTIRLQLLLTTLVASLLMIMVGSMGLRNTYNANESLKNVYEESVIPIRSLKVIGDSYSVTIGTTLSRALNQIISSEDALLTIEIALDDIEKEWESFVEKGMENTEDEEDLIRRLESQMARASAALQEVKNILVTKDFDRLKDYLSATVFPALEPIAITISQIIDVQLNEVKSKYTEARQDYKVQWAVALISISIGIMGPVISNILLSRGIVESLQAVREQLDSMVSGRADLTQRLEVRRMDEVGQVSTRFNQFMANLLNLVKRVQYSGIQVTSSSTAISSTSKQLEKTIHDFGSFTNEVGATAKEISATSQELVKTMSDVSQVATGTADLATEGQGNLHHMEETMSQMEEASSQISSRLAVISEKAANITTVVTTITKIADQTNLLSLNASIEAEKAGEYGLGFAVVAREIRRLADQVALATLDIDQMVKEMKGAVSAGVMEMDKFSEEVRRDVGEVKNIGSQLTQIIQQVQTLLPHFESVHEGVQAQADGARQISDSMVQLNTAVDQTSDSLLETNRVVAELNSSAQELSREFSGFKVDEK